MYRPFKKRIVCRQRKNVEEVPGSGEMVQLHDIVNRNSSLFYFDGIISYGDSKRLVQRVPFEVLSIGAYEDASLHTIGKNVWIQSKIGRRLDVWYCLRDPASEYRRFHEPFLWVADFAKHLVDYMKFHKRVSLIHLRRRFSQWLHYMHGKEPHFQQWLAKSQGNTDFRSIAVAHALFLFNQAAQLDATYAKHPLWDEIDPGASTAISLQVEDVNVLRGINELKGSPFEHKTVVTPYVHEAFKHLPFARCFEIAQSPRSKIPKSPDLLRKTSARSRTNHRSHAKDQHSVHVSNGDVVAVHADTNTSWKTDDKMWYGYVQGIEKTTIGDKLNLIWLYRPSDTPCQYMRYPYSKELFLSDHCNCGDDPIYAHEVFSRPQVAFFEEPDLTDLDTEFFVRQKYVEGDSAWITLKDSDFHCDCGVKNLGREYGIGDTLLIARAISPSQQVLEPVVLVEKTTEASETIRVRLLHRLSREVEDTQVQPNELVYTDILEDISIADVSRPCHIRFYTKEDRNLGKIPAPYCRKGTADCFFITHQISFYDNVLKPLTEPWPLINQGWDPAAPTCQAKLKGLDIFCGGGNLGRGLEEGGAIKFHWAVDYFKEAIHTYKANLQEPRDTSLFYGSVNDFLRQAIEGRGGKLVAQVGEVEVISAGSPCQGFSNVNQRKGNDRSLLNVSMVASVISYIDFYRPKYAFLENVLGMAKCGVNGRKENVFAQVICALVGMGYQVRPSTLDAWSFGSPQSRTRLFILITAPGLTPPREPPQSHSHPDGIPGRSLGKTANGLPLGSRYWDLTPFEYVTIGEATRDLPNTDGKTSCITFPDHRVSRPLSVLNQTRISCVPRYPRGMSFVKAAKRGLMPPPQMEAFDSSSKIRTSDISRSWQRVNPDGLIPTVTTCCQPEDGICGSWVHWNDDRVISVMEVRRAQGFPDNEVIVGSPSMQWKIIGNSVARPVALALGMSMRAAWLADGFQESSQSQLVLEERAAANVVHQAAGQLKAIIDASKVTDCLNKSTSLSDSRSEHRTPSHTTGRPTTSPSLPLRSASKCLIPLPTLLTPPEPLAKKHKIQTSPPTPSTSSQEIITISSDSDSETLQGSTAHTSLSRTREGTSSDMGFTKITFKRRKQNDILL